LQAPVPRVHKFNLDATPISSMATEASPQSRRSAGALLALGGLVALATAVGGLGGGKIGRIAGVWRGHVGDDLVFDALVWGLIGSVGLSIATGIVAAPFCRWLRWVGVVVALACLALWFSLFVGPWRIF
jgi:hypothetical protein